MWAVIVAAFCIGGVFGGSVVGLVSGKFGRKVRELIRLNPWLLWLRKSLMRYVPLECDINIAINGPFWVKVANPEHPFTAMLISHSRGTYLYLT